MTTFAAQKSSASPDKPTPLSYAPLKPEPGTELGEKLAALHARIKKELPHFSLPPLYLITDVEGFQKAYGAPIVEVNAYALGDDVKPHRGVFLTSKMMEISTADELVMLIAHEYGHDFYQHSAQTRQAYPFVAPISLASYARASECQADYFAAHFIADADRLLHSSMKKMREANGISEEKRHPLNTHPLSEERLRGRGFAQVVGITPGTVVTFTDRCDALVQLPPPPPTPPVPPMPGPFGPYRW